MCMNIYTYISIHINTVNMNRRTGLATVYNCVEKVLKTTTVKQNNNNKKHGFVLTYSKI